MADSQTQLLTAEIAAIAMVCVAIIAGIFSVIGQIAAIDRRAKHELKMMELKGEIVNRDNPQAIKAKSNGRKSNFNVEIVFAGATAFVVLTTGLFVYRWANSPTLPNRSSIVGLVVIVALTILIVLLRIFLTFITRFLNIESKVSQNADDVAFISHILYKNSVTIEALQQPSEVEEFKEVKEILVDISSPLRGD